MWATKTILLIIRDKNNKMRKEYGVAQKMHIAFSGCKKSVITTKEHHGPTSLGKRYSKSARIPEPGPGCSTLLRVRGTF